LILRAFGGNERGSYYVRRLTAILLGALLAACIFVTTAPVASAEGHFCRWWYPSAVYGGYYLWLECGIAQPGSWSPYWYPTIPYYENGEPYNPIQEPVNF